MKKIYIVEHGEYEDVMILGVFEDKTLAEEYVRRYNFTAYDKAWFYEVDVNEDIDIPEPKEFFCCVDIYDWDGYESNNVYTLLSGKQVELYYQLYPLDEYYGDSKEKIEEELKGTNINADELANDVFRYCFDEYDNRSLVGKFTVKEGENEEQFADRIISMAVNWLNERERH